MTNVSWEETRREAEEWYKGIYVSYVETRHTNKTKNQQNNEACPMKRLVLKSEKENKDETRPKTKLAVKKKQNTQRNCSQKTNRCKDEEHEENRRDLS